MFSLFWLVAFGTTAELLSTLDLHMVLVFLGM